MIGLALSGGGSRAIAFHLGCFRALNDLGLLSKIKVVSSISGGSVIGAYYVYNPEKAFQEFDNDICNLLRKGFQTQLICELFKPLNLANCLLHQLIAYSGIFFPKIKCIPRCPTRTDLFKDILQRDVFPDVLMSAPRKNNMEIIIGACDLRTGTAFRFGNSKSGGWRHGYIIGQEIEVALAVAVSAAYPLLLPAVDRTFCFRKDGKDVPIRVILSDGGVYDNLGIQVLEPKMDEFSNIHSHSCEYIISCNAGHGQFIGDNLPLTFLPRIRAMTEVIHKRVQDASMKRLHHLKDAGIIKGFILPYLGQLDNSLPWIPSGLVKRNEVIDYPTNFAAMSDF